MDEPRWGRVYYCKDCRFAFTDFVDGMWVDVTTCLRRGKETREYQALLRGGVAGTNLMTFLEKRLRDAMPLTLTWEGEAWPEKERGAMLQAIEARKEEDKRDEREAKQELPGDGRG